jgi:dTDP-4-amino-4,6-dideoxygalactose transaminase
MSSEAFIPLSVPDLRGRELWYLERCVADNWVSSGGPFVTELEKRLAQRIGCRGAVSVVNGTAALHLALLGAGVRPGDHVAVPDWTFAATVNAVFHCGAVPVFVDIDHTSWCLDPALVAAALADRALCIRAIIGVDVLGHPADWDALRAACSGREVVLVEDAAGAIGASYKGRAAGALADVATISFNGNKVMTAGGGGLLLSDDETILCRARHLSTQARVGEEYEHDAVGFNYRMTNVNAAVALAQLERLDEMVAARRAIAARYDAALADRDDIRPMPRCNWAESSCWLYSVALESEAAATDLIAAMQRRRIGARRFWRALSGQEPYRDAPRKSSGVAADLSGRVVSLPCSSSLGEEQQDRVIEVLRAWKQ